MKSVILRKSIIVLIILTPLFTDLGCKKQPRCGCGKDVIEAITEGSAYVYYSASARSAYFYDAALDGSTYWFCNPSQWLDTLQKYPSGQMLLVTGNVYYDCTYYMNNSNLGYYTPPVYQVIVSDVKKNNYAKK
jgi:hypothetical protein